MEEGIRIFFLCFRVAQFLQVLNAFGSQFEIFGVKEDLNTRKLANMCQYLGEREREAFCQVIYQISHVHSTFILER